MRRTTPVRIGALMDDWLREAPGIARKIAEAKAVREWPSVAGPAAAAYTSSVEVRNGIMTVRITSSVLRNELFMQRADLCRAVNRAVGAEAIRTIIIK